MTASLKPTLEALQKRAEDLWIDIYALTSEIETIPDVDRNFARGLWDAEDASQTALVALDRLIRKIEAHE